MDQQSILKKDNRISGKAAFVIPILRQAMMLYLLVWSVSPNLSVDMIFRVAALGCAGGWFLLTIFTDFQFGAMQKLSLVFLLLVIMVALFEYRFNYSKLMKPIPLYMLMLTFLMSSYYSERWDELRFLIPVFIVLLIAFNFTTFNELLKVPSLARRLVRADESMYSYLRRGVGGYALIYSQVILAPLLLAWTLAMRQRNWLYLILGITHMVSFILLLYKAGYTIAIVASLSGVVVLFYYKRKSIIPAFVIALSVMFVIVVVIGYVTPVREFLLSLFNGTTVADKINDIYETIHETGTADSISLRRARYTESVNAILNYPFIGALTRGYGGGHSAILDAFAKYGLFGGFMYVYMICFGSHRLKNEAVFDGVYPLANSMLVSLLTVALLDSLPYEMIFPLMIIAPLIFYEIGKIRSNMSQQEEIRSDYG